jgi:hypothetical protein
VYEGFAKGRSPVQGVFQVPKNGRPYNALVCCSIEAEEAEEEAAEEEEEDEDNAAAASNNNNKFNFSLTERKNQLQKELFNDI